MSDQPASMPTPLWSDPLFSPGDRFPLGPPNWHWEGCEDEPSGRETRPFSLRGVVAGPRPAPDLGTYYGYCEDRQVGLVRDDDGSMVPLLRHTRPGPTEAQTTGYKTDGNPNNPPPEEMGDPDYQTD
jgi:hypothetical protein